ncbi:MAG: glycoside hydrolase family 5 protein [Ruminococcus sp.]|nr:glycoside hydrolase family 5 protein [Ruminococcus sp.]
MDTLIFETAEQAVRNITAGINTGNSLEANGRYTGEDIKQYELQWGEPPLKEELFEAEKAAGFNAIRLPVTWKHHFNENGKIDAGWLEYVASWVDKILSLGLYCILNIHHDGGEGSWIVSSKKGYEQSGELFGLLWEQIAKRFENCGERLLFEAVNEPINEAREWEANDPDSVEGTMLFNQKFVDTVRAGGGNNPQRNLIVMPYAGSGTKGRLDTFKMPDDTAKGHLILEVHNYDPEGFCWHKAPWTVVRDSWGSKEDYEQIAAFAKRLDEFKTEWGVPAIVGEFGSQDKQNEQARALHAKEFVSAMRSIGVKCFWWECGDFCIFDREKCEVRMPLIATALTE